MSSDLRVGTLPPGISVIPGRAEAGSDTGCPDRQAQRRPSLLHRPCRLGPLDETISAWSEVTFNFTAANLRVPLLWDLHQRSLHRRGEMPRNSKTGRGCRLRRRTVCSRRILWGRKAVKPGSLEESEPECGPSRGIPASSGGRG